MPDHVMPLPRRLVAVLKTLGPGQPDALVFAGARGAEHAELAEMDAAGQG